MKQIICFFVLLFSFLNISQSQTRFITKSGNQILGIVVRENLSEVIVNSLNDEQIVIPLNSIVKRDTLYFGIQTKSGIRFEGTIKILTKDGFELESKDGLKMSVNYDLIDKLFYGDSELRKVMESKFKKKEIQLTNDVYNTNDDKVVSTLLKNVESYHKFGFALLTPGIGNFVYGHTSNKLGFHLSGGYWGDVAGLQIGPTINLSLNKNNEHNMVLSYSYIKINNKHFESFNLLWEANFSGFHIQAGLGFGAGSFSSPQLMCQIGYAYRWAN